MKRFYSFLSVFVLSIVAFALHAQTVVFDPSLASDRGTAASGGKFELSKDGVTFSVSNGVNNTAAGYRSYKGATMTFTVTGNNNITSIELECLAIGSRKFGPGVATATPEGYTFTEDSKIGKWTGSAQQVTFSTAANQMRIKKITIILNNAPSPKPVIVPTDATIAQVLEFTDSKPSINLTLNKAKVVYVDGKTCYLRERDKAIIFYNTKLELPLNSLVSGKVSMDFRLFNELPEMIDNESTDMSQLTVTPSDEPAQPVLVTIEDILSKRHLCDLVKLENVTISKDEEGKFPAFYANANNQTLRLYKSRADYSEYINGQTYDVLAVFNSIYKGTPQVQPIEFTVAGGTVVNVPAPTFTPVAGEYQQAQTITINVPEGTTVYYTTDGNTPNKSSIEYTEPFTITETTTVKAIAYNSEGITSPVATALYTINIPVAENEADFDFQKNPWNLHVADSLNDKAAYIKAPIVSRGVTLTVVSGNTPARMYRHYLEQKSQLRAYTGSTLTFQAPTGYKIQKIEFFTSDNGFHLSADGLTEQTWTGDAENVTFNATGRNFIKRVLVTLDKKVDGINNISINSTTNTIFDLQGRRLQKANKGLYIINGKKVMFK